MAQEMNRQVLLASTPDGMPAEGHFTVAQSAIVPPKEGEILCRNLFLSLDPYMRSQIAGRHMSGSIAPGDVLKGETIAEIVESKHPDFKTGDKVIVPGGWQTHTTLVPKPDAPPPMATRRLNPAIYPMSLALGALGMPGLTAYAGLKHLGQPKAGDVVVVSAASGAVGSMVGQFAKSLGCKVIGIAGSPDKCKWLTNTAGFDGCINYKDEAVADGLDHLCPKGVDIYFDNVGGEILDAVSWRLAIGARVILCGLISKVNSNEPVVGPSPGAFIKARATVRGLVVYDFWDQMDEMAETFMELIEAGKMHFLEDVSNGIEEAPAAFVRLMHGQNHGKTIIKLL